MQTEIEKVPCFIGIQHRITAEHVIFQNTGKRPGHAAIGGISPAALPEVGQYAVKLAPTDCDLVAVGWINGNGRLIGSVAENIVAIGIDVHLETDEWAELRDHSRPSLEPVCAQAGYRKIPAARSDGGRRAWPGLTRGDGQDQAARPDK